MTNLVPAEGPGDEVENWGTAAAVTGALALAVRSPAS